MPPLAGQFSMTAERSMGQTAETDSMIFSAREGRASGVEFVEVKALGLPVFVEAEGKVEAGLTLEPGDVGARFGGGEMAVVAVEIDAEKVFAAVKGEACQVKAGAEPNGGVAGPAVFLEETEDGKGAGGFVAVNAGGKVKADAGIRQRAAVGDEVHFRAAGGDGVAGLVADPVFVGDSGLDFAEDVLDVDGFAVVTADVFSQARGRIQNDS